MPIYDNNGSINHRISTLYDNNGSVNHQQSKVYDNDGSASRLVYSSRMNVISSDGSNAYLGGWNLIWGPYTQRGELVLTPESGPIQYIELVTESGEFGNHAGCAESRSTGTIHVAGFRRCHFNIVKYIGGLGPFRVGFSKTVWDGANAFEVGLDVQVDNSALYKTDANFILTNGVTPNTTHDFDVSALSGDYYLYFGVINGGATGNNRCAVTDIWLE